MQSPGPNKYNLQMNSIEAKSKAAIFSDKVRDKYVPKKLIKPEGPGVGQYKGVGNPHVLAQDTRSACYSFFKTKRPSII